MEIIYKAIILIFSSIIGSQIYANNYKLAEDSCATVDIKDTNLFLKISNCKKKEKLIDKIEFPSNSPNVNFIAQEIINNKKYIILSMSYSEDYRDSNGKLGYAGNYNIVNIYECDKKCIINNKASNFFGNGGDVIDLNLNEIRYKFPYSNLNSIKMGLKSKLFNEWYLNKIVKGKVINKTYINDVSNYTDDHLGYLIKGDNFIVKDISAGWLDIVYKNKKGRTITGWILCADTNLCH